MTETSLDFLIDRANLRTVEWREARLPELRPGEARLSIDRFALTANNVTYALFGDKMRYWDFFPAPEGYGRMPVWGFADVAESRVEGLSVGERVYGYLPVSTDVVVAVEELDALGFVDASPWRVDLASTYNRYVRTSALPALTRVAEPFHAVFQPLFATAFLIADFLDENDLFGACSVLISSASSKTALALGYLLRVAYRADVKTIGLTSENNAEFVAASAIFDRSETYSEIINLPVVPTVFVDMAGSASVRGAVHFHFADALKYSCAVGGSHWEDAGRASGLPGPRPTLFFAPGRAAKRTQDWGVGVWEAQMAEHWPTFLEAASHWLQVRNYRGTVAVETLYQDLVDGKLAPDIAAMAGLAR